MKPDLLVKNDWLYNSYEKNIPQQIRRSLSNEKFS